MKKFFTSENIRQLILNTGVILIFYFFSISLTFYNKRYIVIYHFPLSLTICHLCVKFVLSVFIRFILTKYYRKQRTELSWNEYKIIAIPGITSSLDIGLSNWSFVYITVSLYTMTKSTSLVFILLFALLFKLEKKSLSLVIVILFIATGLIMFTYKSTQFSITGFILCLSASFLSGIRWTSSQIITQHDNLGLQNPIDVIYHVEPWMILTLFPLSAGVEGVRILSSVQVLRFESFETIFHTCLISLGGSLLAFCLEISEYWVIGRTSGLTLCITSIIKEIVTITLAVVINKDQLNMINVAGLLLCLSGISLHAYNKIKIKQNESSPSSHSVTSNSNVYRLLESNDAGGGNEVNISEEESAH